MLIAQATSPPARGPDFRRPDFLEFLSANPQRERLPSYWQSMVGRLDYAYQPIVNIHTGHTFGYEALLRRHQDAGFQTPQDFFDAAHREGVLETVEMALRELAIGKFARLPNSNKFKLFLNIDNRSLTRDDQAFDRTGYILKQHAIAETNICLEISERHPFDDPANMAARLASLKRYKYNIAIDDFGTGFSGLQTLYFAEPHFIKIDRFFICDAATDSRKRLFLSQIVGIAHLLGAIVVAEGVESEEDFFTCRDIGCDLVQGYLAQRPTENLADLKPHYGHIEYLSRKDRRNPAPEQKIIWDKMENIPALLVDDDMNSVFEHFRVHKGYTYFPVIEGTGEPVGIVRETDLKEYIYSTYGKDLICNKTYGRTLKHFVTRCPIVDLRAKTEHILEVFSTHSETHEGLIIVDNTRYVGFLSARSLLRVIHEKNLASARDQNPLTRLPGNTVIYEYISSALADETTGWTFVYFDFDNFKPFNDNYGFRLGDRAILMFAELLAKELSPEACFIGHIGGDDFFAGFRDYSYDSCDQAARRIVGRFRRDAESFYDDKARRSGWITARDREGTARRIPLLGVSAAVLALPAGQKGASSEDVAAVIAELKKSAKVNGDHVSAASLIGVLGA